MAGDGVMDTPVLTGRLLPTSDMATHTALDAILPTVIRMSIRELLGEHVIVGINYLRCIRFLKN